MKIQIIAIEIMIFAVLLCGCAPTKPSPPEFRPPAEIKKGSDEDLILRWKVQIVTIDDVEGGKTIFDKPSGIEWDKFKTAIRSTDELWYFCSPHETWEKLMGCRGYAILRNGRLITHYTTAEN